MVLSPAFFHNSSTDFRSRLHGASLRAEQNTDGVVLPAVGSPPSLVADGNMVPAMRVPHMGIDSDNGKPVADQSGKAMRQLDDLSGLPVDFFLFAGNVSNDDDLDEDVFGLSAFADLAAGDNLGKDVGSRVAESVLKSSGVALSGVEADFFSSDGIGRGSRLRSKPLRFKSPLVVKSAIPPAHDSLVTLCPVNGVGTSLCGGAIGKAGIQACVAPILAGSSHCGFQSHSFKARTLLNGSLCIRTPSSTGKDSMYMSSILQSSSVVPEVVSALLQVKCTVKTWSTLLSNFHGLSIREIMTLIMKVDDLAINKVDYVTPHKRREVVKN